MRPRKTQMYFEEVCVSEVKVNVINKYFYIITSCALLHVAVYV